MILEAQLRERIEYLEEENRQLRQVQKDEQTILRYMVVFDVSRRNAMVLDQLMRRIGITNATDVVAEGTLKVYIFSLRRKLARFNIFIHAMRGTGYRLTDENKARVRSLMDAAK